MSVIKFDEYKEEIQHAIQAKITGGAISDPAGFILIDGFINMPFHKEFGGGFTIGGPTIPAVAVVGKTTGLIHTFALKVLLPNIQF
jgi:hypothetical protein